MKTGKCKTCGADTYTGGDGIETHGKYLGHKCKEDVYGNCYDCGRDMTKKALESFNINKQIEIQNIIDAFGNSIIDLALKYIKHQSNFIGMKVKADKLGDECMLSIRSLIEKVREETLSEVRSKLPEEKNIPKQIGLTPFPDNIIEAFYVEDQGYNRCLKEIKNLICQKIN